MDDGAQRLFVIYPDSQILKSIHGVRADLDA